MEAFAASYGGRSEPDRFNALVMGADLGWRQVGILRAIGRYLRQTGSTYSQTYVAQALNANVEIARMLVALFDAKFDPDLELSKTDRADEVEDHRDKIKLALDSVASLDHDKIIRSYLAIIDAVIRTSFYQPGRDTIALKLLPRKIPDLPQPRPAYEIFVYSPRVEGVHLRFGSVARGGLRWSDRAEDFRTEILGLVKAQMVKNTVIVPVGAKGGFYCKQLPDPAADREAWLAEGKACYRLFISSLLELTDNIVDGAVVPPEHVVRYDGDDPYLVVAADKGTATFSDIANGISIDHGFWLGDAFASGGSAGYDHKGMGITAKGAWASVQRHFREMGIDTQTQDFTCVGIGDMSGDVFGNGMLLSQHIKLVAAFDHRHLMIDPDPDPAASWAERKRLFDLPRSSWADYDTSLISAGGGIFPRTLKSIAITPQMRTALGLADGVAELSPAELISACLRAPVGLLWNGGIGTYVKATAESHAQVGDKANDGLRVNGSEVRARCVGEGGNLGLTQLGRIEYAMKGGEAGHGGRINTDFIDNSAGVDTSDHEVNIKILLAGEVAAGRLTGPDRDTLLASMTDEVSRLVLKHNDDQNLALASAVFQAPSMAGVHEDWMERLEERGILDREIEFLPGAEELAERRRHQQGLTSPELSTLMSYTKIMLAREVLSSDLPDDPDLADRLVRYFPTPLRDPLRRPDPRAPAEPGDHHHGAGQRLREQGRHHLLPPAVLGDGGLGGRPDPRGGGGAVDLRGGRVGGRHRGAGPPDPGGGADRPAAGGPHPGRAGDALAGQQPAAPDRHQRDSRLLRRTGGRAASRAARAAVRSGRRGVRQEPEGVHRQGGVGRAGQPDRHPAVPVPGADHRGHRGPAGRRRRRRRQRALLPRPAAGTGPVAAAHHRAAAQRPLGDHGPGRAAGRPARGAGRPGGGGDGGQRRRLHQAPDLAVGEGHTRGRGVDQDAALHLRRQTRPGQGLGRDCGSRGDCCRAPADHGLLLPAGCLADARRLRTAW